MAFATGHTARTGFTAGQLKDGDSFGTIDAASYNGQAVKFKIDLRYYKNTLVPVVTVLKASDNTVIEQPAIKQAQYLLNVVGLALPNNIQALKDLAALSPTPAKIQSIGLIDGGLVPVNPSGESIPFEQNADGKVSSFISPADATKAAAETAAKQSETLNKLVSTIVPGTSATTQTAVGGVTTTTTTGMSNTVKIALAVAAALVVGVVIYMATRKKKGGSKK